jgi:hypothetical protein
MIINRVSKHPVLIAIVLVAIIVACLFIAFEPTPTTTTASDTSPSTIDTSSANQQQEQSSAPAPVTPNVYQGSGDDVLAITKPGGDGAAIVKFECTSCTDNTEVKTNGAESLIVNTIGAYTGQHIIDVQEGGNTTQLTITATGSWKVTVGGLGMAIAETVGQPVSGSGDDVVHMTGTSANSAITNDGSDNFVVRAYPEAGGRADLAVNIIGSYKATVPLIEPSYVLVTSTGNWSITPR